MDNGFRPIDTGGHLGDWVEDHGDCSGPYGPTHGEYGDTPVGPDVGAPMPQGLAEGPMLKLPGDLWRLIALYLLSSESLSLRSTASALMGHLKVLNDGIVEGCRTIEQLTHRHLPASETTPDVIEKLSSIKLVARSDMLRRYARKVGLARCVVSAESASHKFDPTQALINRYFQKSTRIAGSRDAQSATSWARTIDTTKAELLSTSFDVSCSIALSDLYAADMYAPLLGVVENPEAHMQRVMAAARKLSTLRWMDFLYAVGPLKDVCSPIAGGYKALVADFDRRYPMPRIEVLATIVRVSMGYAGTEPVRDVCLSRMGVDPRCLEEQITPRIAQSVAEAILSDPLIRGISVAHRLQMFAKRWDNDDAAFPASLHQAFVSALAQRSYCGSTPWARLPEAVRRTLHTRVLGISLNDSERYGLKGRSIFDFWGLYFEIADPNTAALSPKVESRIDALHWPLQARLWRLAADGLGDPDISFSEQGMGRFQISCFKRVDILCTQALMARRPALAISALQASLKWQVIGACEAYRRVSKTGGMTGVAACPALSRIAWTVFSCCTVAERLPLIAALFTYRDVLAKCNSEWDFRSVIAKDVVAFLCDAQSSLIQPSSAVVDVLMYYLPLCGERLPEFPLGPDACEAALARRLDLPGAYPQRDVWDEATLSIR